MLLDINGKILTSPIEQTPIRKKWREYIKYKKNTRLWSFTKSELLERINLIKRESKSIIESAVLIGRFLRELSVNENFNQQFSVAFPNLNSDSLLAMQLYMIMLEDEMKWTFVKPEKEKTIFVNANYIIADE
ncbi:MAG TPA: hypothetical protein VFC69_09130 [Dysgonamonadaceae bacterium]|nr:hypothetical protein [Dysgonamonadaceae bacterium]